MNPLLCPSCGASREPEDNFCRRCGRQVTITLPAVREENLPTEARGLPPSLVGSIAVLALGTGLEWLARRAAGGASKALANAIVGRAKPLVRAASPTPANHSDAVSIDEVVYIRQVRLRR